MLFDLKGRRRRVVQVTYLTLAVLMGGGLVFFGIGGEVSGGLFDAFSDRSSNDNGSDVLEKQEKEAERRLRANPRDEEVLKALVRVNYQLASSKAGQSTTFPPEAKTDLRQAAAAWERYLALDPDPVDESLAGLMLQAYGIGALEQPDKAVETAEILAAKNETPESYIILAQYASLAGQTRKADLAGRKAVDLAPRDQRDIVKQQVEQAKAASAIQQTETQQGGSG